MYCDFLAAEIVIVTENTEGDIYALVSDSYNEIVNDWNGDAEYVPANDAKVYFALYKGRPINPHLYTDFESVIKTIRSLIK